MKNHTTITLNNRPVTLVFDKHARFRYGQHGGNIALLAVAGQDYFQSLLLIWAALSDNDRQLYTEPSQLVDHIEPEDDALFEPVIVAVIAAGWIQPAEPEGSAGASGTASAE